VFGFNALLLNFFLGLYLLIPSSSFKINLPPANLHVVSLFCNDNDEKSTVNYSNFIDFEASTLLEFSKYVWNKTVSKIEPTSHLIYNSKLLYLALCKFIDPNLSPTTIIFPFHCFT